MLFSHMTTTRELAIVYILNLTDLPKFKVFITSGFSFEKQN